MTRLVLFLLLVTPIHAGPSEPGPAPRLTDRYGDPLPVGAIARLGSLRLRHADLTAFAFPPGGKTVVTVGGDRFIRTWDLESGRPIRAVRLPGHVSCDRVTLTADGKTMATHAQGEITICDAASGRVVQTFPRPNGYVDCLAISPNGSTLIFGIGGHLVTLIEIPGGARREVRVADPPAPYTGRRVHPLLQPHFSRDGRRLLVTGMNGPKGFSVLDVATGRELFSRPGNPTAAALSADGNRVAAIGLTKTDRDLAPVVRLFDVQAGKEIAQLTPDIGRGEVDIHFSADDKALICLGSRGGGYFDPLTGRLVRKLPVGVRGAPSPDGRWIADWDMCRLHVWDAVTGRKLHDSPGLFRFGARAASPDGRLLAAEDVCEDRIGIWDTTDGRFIRYLARPEAELRKPELMLANNGRTLMTCEFGGMVRMWALRTGVATWPVTNRGRVELSGPNITHCLSPDGRRVVAINGPTPVADRPYRLELWDAATGVAIGGRGLPIRDWVTAAGWLPDGSAVVVLLPESLTFVDPDTGRLGPRIPATGEHAFSADGRLMATWERVSETGKGTLLVWELASGAMLAKVDTQGSVYHAFGLAADRRAVVIADGQTLRVVDLLTGEDRGRRDLPTLGREGPGETPVSEVQVLPGDKRALTTLNDGTALVWDLTAFPIEKLTGKRGEAETQKWWDELAEVAATRGYTAQWKFAEAAADEVVAFLRERLKPVPIADPKEVRRLVADLGSPTFAAREAATKRLGAIGAGIVPALQIAVRTTDSAEVRERAGKLLDPFIAPVPPPETLRAVRAVAVLERTGTADARRLLRELAGGEPTDLQTKAAKSALGRLESASRGGW